MALRRWRHTSQSNVSGFPSPLRFRSRSARRPNGFLTLSLRKKGAWAPRPLWTCPQCGGPMVLIKRLSSMELRWRSPPPPGYSHDSIFDITASARVPPLSPHVCPRCPPWGCETPEKHVPTTTRNAHRQYFLPIASFLHSFRNSKYIARRFHNGFLQVAVSKTLRRSAVQHSRNSPRRIVPDTVLRLLGLDW